MKNSFTKILWKAASRFIPLLLWIAVIYLSSTRETPFKIPSLFYNSDKLNHFILYIPFGFLFLRAWPLQDERFSLKWVVLIVSLLAGGFGLLIEYVQLYIPDRCFELMDGLADTLGSLFGAAIYVLYKKRLDKFNPYSR